MSISEKEWIIKLQEEIEKQYNKELYDLIQKEYKNNLENQPREDIFNALHYK